MPNNTEINDSPEHVAILGAGSWGTAIAHMLADNGHAVTVWDRNSDLTDHVNAYHINSHYLPNITLPESINATSVMREAVTPQTNWVVLAVASVGVRAVAAELCELLTADTAIVSATKGLEEDTGLTTTEIVKMILHDAPYSGIGVLSGPNLAQEVVRGVPSVAVIASDRQDLSRRAQQLLMSRHHFRIYTHTDIKGVELAGALKNVLAIGAGISDGLGFGDNTKAALMTRGLMEMTQLGLAAGARPLTFLGLAGVGDLMATSASRLSRNYRVGLALAERKPLTIILEELGQVAEGVSTAKAAILLAKRFNTETPLFETLHDVIHNRKSPSVAVSELMSRPAKEEYV